MLQVTSASLLIMTIFCTSDVVNRPQSMLGNIDIDYLIILYFIKHTVTNFVSFA